MELLVTQKMIKLLAEILECDEATLKGDSCFREHENWDSLAHLATLAMIDEQFDVVITQHTFQRLRTISELAGYIEQHKGAT